MLGFEKLYAGTAEDFDAITGCTVLIFEGGAGASADVRGASPGTREIALLAPDKQIDRIDAILLTGGSAFGLAAATGVVRFLSEHAMGYETPWRRVPIVPAAVLFDLNIGSPDKFPDEEMGYRACQAAMKGEFKSGAYGAGTGATIGKWSGIQYAMKSGQGIGEASYAETKVLAIAVVNAVGDVVSNDGMVISGAAKEGKFLGEGKTVSERLASPRLLGTNTTLVTIVTNSGLSKVELSRVAQRGHDALARRIIPVHTSLDGDTVFAVSLAGSSGSVDLVASLAVEAIEKAIEDSVRSSKPLGGFKSYSDL